MTNKNNQLNPVANKAIQTSKKQNQQRQLTIRSSSQLNQPVNQ